MIVGCARSSGATHPDRRAGSTYPSTNLGQVYVAPDIAHVLPRPPNYLAVPPTRGTETTLLRPKPLPKIWASAVEVKAIDPAASAAAAPAVGSWPKKQPKARKPAKDLMSDE
jgi:hypothetical protein